MANKHFGNIGDIWKHLPLAEVLALERPRIYWESHAGSASYALASSAERAYGIFNLLERGGESGAIAGSRFWRLLEGLRGEAARLACYPGSPLVAMEVLRGEAAYVFCDTDGESLATIRDSAASLSIGSDRLRCVDGDGVAALLERAERLPRSDRADTLVFIDPFTIDWGGDAGPASGPSGGPAERPAPEGRPSPLNLFARLAGLGVRALLWYGFDSAAQRRPPRAAIERLLAVCPALTTAQATAPWRAGLWCGEISLEAMEEADLGFNPGVRGCGLLAQGLSGRTLRAIERLGRELARIYQGTVLPGGQSGALRFEVVRFGDAPGALRGQAKR